MSFSPIADGMVHARHDQGQLAVSWTPQAAGSTYQVYLDRVLAWSGTACRVVLPWPRGRVAIDVGTVGPADASADLSGSFPAAPRTRASLSWQGGRYQSPALAAYEVHGSALPGGSVSYARPLAAVAAYPGGIYTDGYGMGGYGSGGYGSTAGTYTWTSPSLSPGTWQFAVVAVDAAGNPQAAPTTTTVTIAGPPKPPAFGPGGKRLAYSYNAPNRLVTLTWLPSPT